MLLPSSPPPPLSRVVLTPREPGCRWASPAKLTVTATMMMMIPMMMKVMLSIPARRPSLRAPSRSPCCTLLRDCRERVVETLSSAALQGPPCLSRRTHPGPRCSPHLSSSPRGEAEASFRRNGLDSVAREWNQGSSEQAQKLNGRRPRIQALAGCPFN